MKDANGCLQQVAFGFLLNKTQQGFKLFLQTFKQLSENERNKSKGEGKFGEVFVCDKLEEQSNAISLIFPNSKIIYCKHHLLMDINKYYPKTPLYRSYCEMITSRILKDEKQFLEELNKLTNSNFKTLLINNLKYYLPSIVDNYYHRNNLTCNLSECSFNVLKRRCDWTKLPITTLIERIARESISLLNNSINQIIKIPFILFGRVDPFIGKFALDYLNIEYSYAIQINSEEECNCECNGLKTMRLPCRHWLAKNPLKRIIVSIEYIRLKCNLIKTNDKLNEPKECLMEKINI